VEVTIMRRTLTLLTALLLSFCAGNLPSAPPAGNLIHDAEMAGYLFGAAEKAPVDFNAGYHYLGCAKTFALMGKTFAGANLKLLESHRP
jgi:hypothetical protein